MHGGGLGRRRPEFEDLMTYHVPKAAGRPAFAIDYSLASPSIDAPADRDVLGRGPLSAALTG